MIQWLIQMWDVELGGKLAQYIPQIECRKTVDQLGNNPIAKGELLRWNDTNRKPFASILYKFLVVMLCAAVRKAAVLQMKCLRAR